MKRRLVPHPHHFHVTGGEEGLWFMMAIMGLILLAFIGMALFAPR